VVKNRNNSSGIHKLQTDNGVIEDPKLIEDHILDFYKNPYVDSNPNAHITGNMEDLIGTYIPTMVSSGENIMLIKCPDYLEIKNVAFNLNGNSALGPDSFGRVILSFMIGDYWDKCLQCYSTIFFKKWILPKMNSNVVSLIPKIQGADSIKDFRPIVAANFKLKIISKILVDRLDMVASRIISLNQYGFVQCRQIHDCIGIASKAINMLSKR